MLRDVFAKLLAVGNHCACKGLMYGSMYTRVYAQNDIELLAVCIISTEELGNPLVTVQMFRVRGCPMNEYIGLIKSKQVAIMQKLTMHQLL